MAIAACGRSTPLQARKMIVLNRTTKSSRSSSNPKKDTEAVSLLGPKCLLSLYLSPFTCFKDLASHFLHLKEHLNLLKIHSSHNLQRSTANNIHGQGNISMVAATGPEFFWLNCLYFSR